MPHGTIHAVTYVRFPANEGETRVGEGRHQARRPGRAIRPRSEVPCPSPPLPPRSPGSSRKRHRSSPPDLMSVSESFLEVEFADTVFGPFSDLLRGAADAIGAHVAALLAENEARRAAERATRPPLVVATDASKGRNRRGTGLGFIAESGEHRIRVDTEASSILGGELLAIEMASSIRRPQSTHPHRQSARSGMPQGHVSGPPRRYRRRRTHPQHIAGTFCAGVVGAGAQRSPARRGCTSPCHGGPGGATKRMCRRRFGQRSSTESPRRSAMRALRVRECVHRSLPHGIRSCRIRPRFADRSAEHPVLHRFPL